MTQKRAPSPRYRTDDATPVIQPTADDLRYLWHVYCNRIIDSHSIAATHPERPKLNITRRLNKLRKGSEPFLHRIPYISDRVRNQPGSEPMVYALANRGAQVLDKHRQDVSIPHHRWAARNDALKATTIEHELATSRIMGRLAGGASLAGADVRLLYQEEFEQKIRDKRRKVRGIKNTLHATIENWHGYRGQQGTAPDRIFAVDADGQRRYVFLEIDQETETIVPEKLNGPNFWKNSSLLRKFVIYHDAFEQKAHRDQFGFDVFQILTMTTTASHAKTMREAIATHIPTARDGLFLFGDWETFNRWEGNPLAFPWLTVKGREKPFI